MNIGSTAGLASPRSHGERDHAERTFRRRAVRMARCLMDSDKFIHEVQRYKARRGVYAAAQSLRRQGISLEAALLLLAGESWDAIAAGRSVPPTQH